MGNDEKRGGVSFEGGGAFGLVFICQPHFAAVEPETSLGKPWRCFFFLLTLFSEDFSWFGLMFVAVACLGFLFLEMPDDRVMRRVEMGPRYRMRIDDSYY